MRVNRNIGGQVKVWKTRRKITGLIGLLEKKVETSPWDGRRPRGRFNKLWRTLFNNTYTILVFMEESQEEKNRHLKKNIQASLMHFGPVDQ